MLYPIRVVTIRAITDNYCNQLVDYLLLNVVFSRWGSQSPACRLLHVLFCFSRWGSQWSARGLLVVKRYFQPLRFTVTSSSITTCLTLFSAIEVHSNQLVDYLLFNVVSAVEVHSNQLVNHYMFYVVSAVEVHSNQLVDYLLLAPAVTVGETKGALDSTSVFFWPLLLPITL